MKMSHVGIMVGEMDRAVEFYTKALGLEIVMGKSEVMEEWETAIGKMCIAGNPGAASDLKYFASSLISKFYILPVNVRNTLFLKPSNIKRCFRSFKK